MAGTCITPLLLLLGAVATLVSSLPTEPVAAAPADEAVSPLMNSCLNKSRQCIVGPQNCVLAAGNCTVILSAEKRGESFVFDMQANYTQYVSVALGASNIMGNDSVLECVKEGDSVKAYLSLNTGENHKHRGNKRLPADENQKGITLLGSKLADGIISCSVQRDQKTSVAGKDYDLESGTWYLQVAAGDKRSEDGGIGHHNVRGASENKVRITKDGIINSATTSGASALLLVTLVSMSGLMHS